MPERLSAADLDALVERLQRGTAALRDAEQDTAAADVERRVLGDLRMLAGELRTATGELGAALASTLGAAPADPEPSKAGPHDGAGRHHRGDVSVDPLTRFAIRRGTDKWGPHFYTPIYHELFAPLRHVPIRLLEIGVGGHESAAIGGASLLMWADYFPHARIVGIDIAEKQLEPHPRIAFARGSQEDTGFLTKVVAEHGPFDVIIDDGSHVPAHVLASFTALFPTLTEQGLYVIEDVQTAFWPQFGGSPTDGAETMALARDALLAINHAEIRVVQPGWTPPPMASSLRCVRAYHNMLVFQKGDNLAPSSKKLVPDDAHVTFALAAMEQELALDPTPEGLAQLARTYRQAGALDKAVAVVQRGLAQWPDHVQLQAVADKVAKVARAAGRE